MAKIIIREVIISLLVCLAILLILSIALYNYIPSNKPVPEKVEYTPSSEIQTQLNSVVDRNSSEIIMTYEVTASDLKNYETTKQYNKGKANPFAPISETPEGGQDGEPTTTTPGGSTTTPDKGSSSNANQGGSLFEGNSSK